MLDTERNLSVLHIMKTEIHPALKHKHIAEWYYSHKGKYYTASTAQKMFHQDLRTDKLDEKVLLKVLKQLVNEQIKNITP